MASIVPGYEYDIFISYRQKDNKGDRWVSEFVEALKIELESTFKEEVSLYFDINPSDGLLETHDVDASLKEKLRCLVFIPVISRTYCDPKCFAWEHELKSFVETASRDQFGLKINLPNGNVASRVLPIRIHDLDKNDLELCELLLGGVLRGVDFVYKTPGVNRPLLANEDNPQDNLNKTYYRNQINKTANAVKEIITAIKKHDLTDNEAPKKVVKLLPEKSKNLKTKIIFVSTLLLLMLIPGYIFISKLSASGEPAEIRIAVLPFDKFFSDKDKDNAYLCEAIPNRIIDKLRDVKEFLVIPYNSTRQFYGQDRPSSKQICKECGADILVYGQIELFNNNTDATISVQLVNKRNNNPVWHEKFENKLDSLQASGTRIIIKIAKELQVELSSKEVKQIKTDITKSSDAYNSFLSANYYQNNAAFFAELGKKYNDSLSFELAINMYNKAIRYDSAFALAYAGRSISRSFAYFAGSLTGQTTIEKCKEDIDKALILDPNSAEAQNASGFYYYYCKSEYQKALECFKKASDLNPTNWQPFFYQAIVYRRIGEWKKSQALLTNVLKYNPQDALILTNIGMSYNYLRNYDSALIYHDMAIKIMPNWSSPYYNKAMTLILNNGSTHEARIVIDTAYKKTGDKFQKLRILLDIYDSKFSEALVKTQLSKLSDFDDQGDKLLHYAMINNYLDKSNLAKIYYDSALVFFKKRLNEDPEKPTTYINIGLAYAGLKDRFNAIESSKKAMKLSTDALTKIDIRVQLAQIYITFGDYDDGFRLIDDLLKNPSEISTGLLQLDPVWKPIHEKPEYKKLLEEYSKN